MSEYCGQCGTKLDSNGYCQICRGTRQANIPVPETPTTRHYGLSRQSVSGTFWAKETRGESIFIMICSLIGLFVYFGSGLEGKEGGEWWLHVITAFIVFSGICLSVARHMINLRKAEDIEAIRAMLEAQASKE